MRRAGGEMSKEEFRGSRCFFLEKLLGLPWRWWRTAYVVMRIKNGTNAKRTWHLRIAPALNPLFSLSRRHGILKALPLFHPHSAFSSPSLALQPREVVYVQVDWRAAVDLCPPPHIRYVFKLMDASWTGGEESDEAVAHFWADPANSSKTPHTVCKVGFLDVPR